MIPDFFIVGATKCGSSTMHYHLSQNPHIQMSNPKEPRFLEMDYHIGNYEKLYDTVFDYKGENILYGDANPNNLVIKYVPDRIMALNPRAKILILTREPVERAFSHWKYFHTIRPGREPDGFDVIINANFLNFNLDKFDRESNYVPYVCKEWGNYVNMYIETGCYMHYIRPYAEKFDVKVVYLEDYELDQKNVMDGICDWLGVPRHDIVDNRKRNVNKNTNIKIEDYKETCDKLASFYQPYNSELAYYLLGE